MARFRFSFWLDGNKDDELVLMDDIDALKQSRQFASTIRDGIRLIMDLRAGNTDVLFELFPQLKKQMTPTTHGGEGELRREIESLKGLILQQSNPGNMIQASGPRKLDLPRFSEPEEDEAPTLVIKKDTKTNSSQNFLNSLMALQQ